MNGVGNTVNPVGLIASGFRPSDDACTFLFLGPSNLFAVTSLRQLSEMAHAVLHEDALASEANVLAAEVESALKQYVIAPTPHGTIWAYEVDGFGSQLLMDDANVPSLWNCRTSRARRTQRCMRERGRSHGVSRTHGFKGTAGEDIGGPHVAENMIWPMSQMVYALTSSSAAEIGQALALLKESSAGTGFMHESFFKDDAARFTRPWFAWANSPFGELIVKVAATRPGLLK